MTNSDLQHHQCIPTARERCLQMHPHLERRHKMRLNNRQNRSGRFSRCCHQSSNLGLRCHQCIPKAEDMFRTVPSRHLYPGTAHHIGLLTWLHQMKRPSQGHTLTRLACQLRKRCTLLDLPNTGRGLELQVKEVQEQVLVQVQGQGQVHFAKTNSVPQRLPHTPTTRAGFLQKHLPQGGQRKTFANNCHLYNDKCVQCLRPLPNPGSPPSHCIPTSASKFQTAPCRH